MIAYVSEQYRIGFFGSRSQHHWHQQPDHSPLPQESDWLISLAIVPVPAAREFAPLPTQSCGHQSFFADGISRQPPTARMDTPQLVTAPGFTHLPESPSQWCEKALTLSHLATSPMHHCIPAFRTHLFQFNTRLVPLYRNYLRSHTVSRASFRALPVTSPVAPARDHLFVASAP